MQNFTNLVEIDLENLRKTLNMLKKYTYNITYKKHEIDARIELEKDFIRLEKFVIKEKNKNVINILKQLKRNVIPLTKGKDYSKKTISKKLYMLNEAIILLKRLEIFSESLPVQVGSSILPDSIIKKLGQKFETELRDLLLVYSGKSGTCTAFMLRKILEKVIFLAFAKNKMLDKLKHPKNSKKFVGLEKMINLASSNKANDGTPFIIPKIAEDLKKLKFLGDIAAHDFLYNVDIELIENNKDIIAVALGQISEKV